MSGSTKGAELLALVAPIRVEDLTDELVRSIVARLDCEIRDAVAMTRDSRQGLALMLGVLSLTAGMVGGAAAGMLDLPATSEGMREGKLAALDCIRSLVAPAQVLQ